MSNPATDPFDPLCHHNPPADEEALGELAVGHRLYRSLKDHPLVAVEIGSWAGSSTLILANAGYRVFAVDHWQGNPHDALRLTAAKIGQRKAAATFCQNMSYRLFGSVFPLVGPSDFWASVWPAICQPSPAIDRQCPAWSTSLPIDFLFIDADHAYPSVLADITLWSPHVRQGGIIAGHDFSSQFPGVVQAVQETGPYEVVGQSVWWRKKT